MKHYMMLLAICLSTTSALANSVDHTAPISISELQTIDIHHYLQDDEINMLSVDNKEYLTLVKEQTSGFERGIAFIVPDINQPLTQQPTIKMLYDNLTEYGWRSLLLTMPNMEQTNGSYDDIQKTDIENTSTTVNGAKSSNTEPNIQENTEQGIAKEDDSETIRDPNLKLKAYHRDNMFSESVNTEIEQQVLKRVESAWQYAEQFPGYFIFICQGKTCAWLTSLFQQKKLMPPDALVMLSAHMPQLNLNKQFSLQITQTEFPVLELFKQMDNHWVSSSILQRKKLARKHYKTDYRQRKLNGNVVFGDNNMRTMKEVYGFLTAVGM